MYECFVNYRSIVVIVGIVVFKDVVYNVKVLLMLCWVI